MRVWSTCAQEPVVSRNETDEGVKLLARFENWCSGEGHCRSLERSWISISAVFRCDVTGEDSGGLVSVVRYGNARQRTESC